MARGLRMKIKIGKPKIEKGIPPVLGSGGTKGMPKSRAMPFAATKNPMTKVIPTIRGQKKPKMPNY